MTGDEVMALLPTVPPPWTTEETDACFIVRDVNGQALALVSIGEEEPGPASSSHGVHCHLTVMRGRLRFELGWAKVVWR